MFEEDTDILTVTEDETVDVDLQNDYDAGQNQQAEVETQTETVPDTIFEQTTQPAEPAQSPTQKKETESFVKSSYSTNNLRKVYKKYNVVQTFVPVKKAAPKKEKSFEKFVNEQHNYTPERETVVVEKVKQKPTYTLSQKAKSWLVATVAIFVMLGGLAVYNAIHISNLNKQIAQTQYDITEINKSLEKGSKTLGKLTDEDAVLDTAENEYNMHQATDADTVTIEINDKKTIIDYQGGSNFFDKICEFIRHLFGG